MQNRLAKILDERGIKKTWLARKLGINRNTLAAMIAGSTPPLDRAYRTARILGLTVYDIWPDIKE